jgi:hypothetical protein
MQIIVYAAMEIHHEYGNTGMLPLCTVAFKHQSEEEEKQNEKKRIWLPVMIVRSITKKCTHPPEMYLCINVARRANAVTDFSWFASVLTDK